MSFCVSLNQNKVLIGMFQGRLNAIDNELIGNRSLKLLAQTVTSIDSAITALDQLSNNSTYTFNDDTRTKLKKNREEFTTLFQRSVEHLLSFETHALRALCVGQYVKMDRDLVTKYMNCSKEVYNKNNVAKTFVNVNSPILASKFLSDSQKNNLSLLDAGFSSIISSNPRKRELDTPSAPVAKLRKCNDGSKIDCT